MKSYLVSKHEDEQKNEAKNKKKMQEVIEKFKIKNDKVEDFKHLITFFVYKARVAVPYHSDTIKWC